jgi:RNA polymerase sigma-70 factor (ECF subfamily)
MEAEASRQEADLVEAARTDRQAFGQLYDRHVEAIYHYIAKRVGDPEVAEDLTSTVWEHALAAIEQYELRGLPFSAWLYRIAGNLVANHYRQQRLRRLVPFLGQATTPDSSAKVDDRADVRHALGELSEADREVVSLFYYAGLTPPEIADVLDCSVGVVHKRLSRARERLRRHLEGASDAEDARA